MPAFRLDDLPLETGEGATGPFSARSITKAGGLTQFGAVVEVLPPGSTSSIKHWHAEEDELVFVLDGVATLVEGTDETKLVSGEGATFKAGVALGHFLRNDGDTDLRYLVVGTRAAADRVTYPDHDRVLHRVHDGSKRWATLSGAPASNPYALDDTV